MITKFGLVTYLCFVQKEQRTAKSKIYQLDDNNYSYKNNDNNNDTNNNANTNNCYDKDSNNGDNNNKNDVVDDDYDNNYLVGLRR